MSYLAENNERIETITNKKYHLTSWSPGDGKTRYRIVSGRDDYFGGYAIVTALGKSECETMLSAFCQGWFARGNETAVETAA